MPLKIRHAILPVLGFAAGLAALGAAQSETVVRLANPDAVTVTRLPGTVSGLAGDIAAMAAPAPVRPAPVSIVAPAPVRSFTPSSAAPMRSLRPDPRPEILAANTVVMRQTEAPVALALSHRPAARDGCGVLSAMPDHLVSAAFPAGFAGMLNGARCAK